MKRDFTVCVLPGDGIGIEVIEATLPLLEKVQLGFRLELESYPAGAHHYKRTGEALPEATFDAAKKADAILFGAMGWPDIRYPDGTEIAPQLDLRARLDRYAGVRPARAIPGVPLPLGDARAKDIDLVVVRESTEGLFASRGKGVLDGDRDSERMWRDHRERMEKLGVEGAVHPDAVADTYWHLHVQPRSAWSHEVDLRPWKELF